jgi:hypothetical protein
MMQMTRLVGAALAISLLLGACTSSATPVPVTTQPPASSPAASAAPTGPTGPSASPTQIVPQPSGGGWDVTSGTPPPPSHADPALEAKLPDAIRAVQLTKSSFSGSSMPAEETEKTKPTFDLLKRLGRQPADLAFAVAADPRLNDAAQAANALPLFLIAYRVQGTSAEDLMAALLAVAEKYATSGVEKGTASVGGQAITTYVDKAVPQAGTNYMVPRGDVLYVIQTADEKLAAEALGSLP